MTTAMPTRSSHNDPVTRSRELTETIRKLAEGKGTPETALALGWVRNRKDIRRQWISIGLDIFLTVVSSFLFYQWQHSDKVAAKAQTSAQIAVNNQYLSCKNGNETRNNLIVFGQYFVDSSGAANNPSLAPAVARFETFLHTAFAPRICNLPNTQP